jgi:hypothetical protein
MKKFVKKAGTKAKAKREAEKTKGKKRVIAEEKIGDTVGKVHGLGVVQTWNKLLKENVKAKLTDDQLAEKMLDEFPKRKTMQPVGRIRSWYNHGRYNLGLGDDKVMDPKSTAYDEKGNPVERGLKAMAAKERSKAAAAKKVEKEATKQKGKLVVRRKVEKTAEKQAA